MKEITIEITNYCPHNCEFCSSMTTDNKDDAYWLSKEQVWDIIKNNVYDVVIISGGEPLAHTQFYDILQLCNNYAKHVIVYTNAIKHLAYNTHVLPVITVEKAVIIEDSVDKVRHLKLIPHGRQATRPESTWSRNFTNKCDQCNHKVVRPDGIKDDSPCCKHNLK
jgi:organic radical activating enzyme